MKCERLGVWRPQGRYWRLVALPWSVAEAERIAAVFADAVVSKGEPQVQLRGVGLPPRRPDWWRGAYTPPWQRMAAEARAEARRRALEGSTILDGG